MRNFAFVTGLFFIAMTIALPAWAGPPFITDDPDPVDYQHFELDFFSQLVNTKSGTAGDAPGLDANYGIAPDVELQLITQVAFSDTQAQSGYGYGDTQIGVKYRFINQSEDSWLPEVAIYPVINLPSGNTDHGLGAGRYQEFIPIWLQKDFGNWETFGGGGYWFNSGSGDKNYWYAGWVLQRKITDDLTLGGELYHQSAPSVDEPDSTGFNLGGTYMLNENNNLLFSAGRGIQNASQTNRFSAYIALQVLY